MSFESNNLERDRFIATLVERYLSEGEIGDPERLVDFVLDRLELDDDVLSQLANATIAAEFQASRLRGDDVSIENSVETYCALFDDRALTLDRADLLKRLTQRELYYVADSPLLRADLDELKARFPEIADFFNEYFDRRRRAVFSRSVARFPSDDAPQTPPTRVSTSEHYDVELAPLASDANRRLGKLGSGGLKDVYAARQASTNQTVALKILKNAKSTEARDSFKSEVLIQARITHPNVPEIFSFDENGVAPTLVERLIPGKSWAELLDARTFEENLATLATVSQIVAYAHEQQHIIHGDLKPENVMLGESGGRYNEVYLVDWGLARCLDDEGATTQTLGGTLDYQPPEAFAEVDLELSFATDVFTLGGILFRLLTGAAPYQNKRVAENEFEAERAALSANVPAIPDRNPKTQRVNPQDLIEIATKALRYDPKERYENAAAFVDALERYRRRANLGERLRDAQTSLAELRAGGDAASLASVSLTTLVETANEFRLLREEAARTDADDKPSRLFWEAVESERTARDLLVESALQSKDFGVVESQISVAERLETAVNDAASSSPADPSARQAKIADFRARLRRGLAERRRQRLAKWIAASAILCAVGLSVWSLYEKSQKDAALAQAELANERAYRAQLGELEQTVAPIAAENWAQGEVALRDYVDAPEEMATRLHLAERSGIFLEAAGSRRVIVDSVAFSADERYVATLAPVVGTTIYRASFESPKSEKDSKEQTLKRALEARRLAGNGATPPAGRNGVQIFANNSDFVSVAQFPFADYDGTRYLTANPAFRADAETTGENVDPIAASRFLLCRDDGVVHFLRFDENGATATHKVDFRATSDATNGAKAATRPRASWGVPLFATTADGVRLIVADVSGAASVYAFPEGRLVKRFQLCAPSADAPNALPRLAATPDGRTLVSAGLDGSFKRWSLDGEELETFDLPLGEVDLSLGWLFRPVDVSPDGKTLYASDERGKFVVWDVDAKKPIYVGQEPVNEAQAKLVGAPATTNFLTRIYRLDDARFVTLGFNDRWRVWDLSKRDENGAPTSVEFRDDSLGPSRALRSVAISPSRRFLATQNNSQYFEIYDVESQKALARSEGVLFNRNPVFTISDAAYLPQSDQILCGSFSCRPVVAFDPRTLRVATEYDPYPDADAAFFTGMKGVPSFFAAPNAGDEFAVAFASGDLFFFKDGVSEPIAKLEKAFPDASIDNLPLLAASPDGSRLIGKTLLGDEYVLWDWKTRSEIKRLKFSQDDADAAQVDAEPSAVRRLFQTLNLGLEFLDETTLAAIMPDGSVVRYNVETGERVATTPSLRPRSPEDGLAATTSGAQCYRLSNDRKRLALGFADGFVAVVDLEKGGVLLATGEFAKPLPQRKTAVDSFKTAATDVSNAASGFAWSRDDSLLCVAFGNGRAVLAETLNFTPLETFVVNDSASGLEGRLFVSPFFTRDGKLVTLDTRGYLKRWDFRPSPEKPTVLDARRGANLLTGTARPNVWASLRSLATQNHSFVLKDGDQELYRRPAVAWFDRLTESGASRETFLILDLDGVLSAVDETGAAVETGVDWNLGAPSVPNRNDARAEQERLMLELIQKYPNGDYPPEELEALAKKIDALTNETPTDGIASDIEGEDEIAFEEDAEENAEKIGGFVRVAVAPNRRAFAAIGRGDGALYVLTTVEAAQGWRLVATPEDFDEPFVKLAFRPDSLELAAIREDGVVTFVPFDAAPDGVVWSQKTFATSVLGLFNTDKSGAFAYSPSGRFLLQTGLGSSVWVWDAETRELAQTIELDLYERTQLDALDVSGLAPLRLNGDGATDDAFVVAASDGVLRFYRYNDATQTFAPVYIVSPTTLTEMIDDVALKSVVKDRLFKRETRVVQCLAVSDDGKKLYVGSAGDVYSFDLDEIRHNVATLPEYWRDLDVESATGLRYSPLNGFRSVERDRLLPVERKP